jgi:uncharacterized protein
VSYNGHPVFDMDSHIFENWDLDRTYRDYMDPAYREKYEELSEATRGKFLGSLVWPQPAGRPLGVRDAFGADVSFRSPQGVGTGEPARVTTRHGAEYESACNWDPTIRLRDMDRAAIDASVVFPSFADGFCMLQDVGFEAALNRAYYRFMNDFCAESDGRLRWLANATMRDIPETIIQLRHWAERDENFAGVFISRACPDGSMLDNPVLHPLFAASQALDLPIWIHGGANRPPLTPWPHATNAVYHGIGGMYAISALIGGGVFDLFPTLRVGLFEAGCGWMPWMLEKLDDGFRPGGPMTPNLKRKPSEIVAEGRLYCSVEADEELIAHTVGHLGEDVLLFSTDYPHPGSPWPDGVAMITERQDLSESAKVKLLSDNGKRFLPKLAG